MTNLDLSIQSLKEYTLRMIEKCEDAVDLSIEYTLKKDIRGLKKLIRQDDDIDILREYIAYGFKTTFGKRLKVYLCS